MGVLLNDNGNLVDISAEIPQPSDELPQALGEAAVGTSADYARADHVHPSDASSGIVSTIIYPNNGRAGAEANVTNNRRYVMNNPYPGYFVHCEAQVLRSGKWGATGWYTMNDSTVGTEAHQLLPDDKIVVQTGLAFVAGFSGYMSAPHGLYENITTAPCRVIVTRLGKM